jgi:hypothetical protein
MNSSPLELAAADSYLQSPSLVLRKPPIRSLRAPFYDGGGIFNGQWKCIHRQESASYIAYDARGAYLAIGTIHGKVSPSAVFFILCDFMEDISNSHKCLFSLSSFFV